MTAPASHPMFTIGITTYDQAELLKQAIRSVLEQTYPDFEVLVGNDNPGASLSADLLGLDDPRIRWINHPENLGELGNLNSLLEKAGGRYFSWLADDDFYSPALLETVLESLRRFDFPPCVYTSYALLDDTKVGRPDRSNFTSEIRSLAGKDFLQRYLGGELRAIGTCGFFETGFLRESGGAEKLGSGPFALYSEYLLLTRAGLLEQVVHIDRPLVTYRVHGLSWGCSNFDFGEYETAGRQLIRKSGTLFGNRVPHGEFRRIMAGISRIHWNTYVQKALNEAAASPHFLKAIALLGRRAGEARMFVESALAEAGVDPEMVRRDLRIDSLRNSNRFVLLLRLAYLKYRKRLVQGTGDAETR